MTCEKKVLLASVRTPGIDEYLIAECAREEHIDDRHESHGVKRYASDMTYAGKSPTNITWYEGDRRTFAGPFTDCLKDVLCCLPHDHPRRCAR